MLRTAGGLTVNQTTQFGGYHGSFYSLVQQGDNVGVATPMYCEETALSNGVTMVTDGTHNSKITFANAGTYNIQFSAQVYRSGGGGSGETLNIWFSQNGTAVPASDTKITVTSSTKYTVAAWNFLLTVAAGDYAQIVYLTDNNAIVFPVASASPPAPAIPSVIITACQVA